MITFICIFYYVFSLFFMIGYVLEAGQFVGKPHASVNISACALGKRKTAYGYNWQYI